MKETISTYTGREFDLFHTKTSDIDIRDIAHGLSNTCRFTGQGREFYSVAQHSIIVSQLVPDNLCLAALLHDAAEAYICDLPTPIKHHPGLSAYRELEDRIQSLIMWRFGMEHGRNEYIKEADLTAYAYERSVLFGNSTVFAPQPPKAAERLFLHRFNELFKDKFDHLSTP